MTRTARALAWTQRCRRAHARKLSQPRFLCTELQNNTAGHDRTVGRQPRETHRDAPSERPAMPAGLLFPCCRLVPTDVPTGRNVAADRPAASDRVEMWDTCANLNRLSSCAGEKANHRKDHLSCTPRAL